VNAYNIGIIYCCVCGFNWPHWFIPYPADYKKHSYASIYTRSFASMCFTVLISNYWKIAIISATGAALTTAK
ncbi:hypothetical protein, partial [Modicisalibacter radicis]|uniref:hypothetical protein n=1 Tax=Halomonas sp. EAR18 TaxID=2518972 RepID=UPI001B34BCE6